MARRRYQKGALRKEGKGWILRWREDVLNQAGTVVRIERGARVGERKDLPTKKLARRVADGMIAHVNEPDYRPGRVVTVTQFADVYERDVAPWAHMDFENAKPKDGDAQHGARRYQDDDALYPCYFKRPAGGRGTCNSSLFAAFCGELGKLSL